jgi:hypothetical protein
MSGSDSGHGRPVRVFISYAYGDREHEDQVRQLWVFLRACGVDARLDLAAAVRPGGAAGLLGTGHPDAAGPANAGWQRDLEFCAAGDQRSGPLMHLRRAKPRVARHAAASSE